MSQEFSEYDCFSCEKGIVKLSNKHKRVWRVQGQKHVVSESVLLPTCDQCGNTFLDANDVKRIKDSLQ